MGLLVAPGDPPALVALQDLQVALDPQDPQVVVPGVALAEEVLMAVVGEQEAREVQEVLLGVLEQVQEALAEIQV